MRLQCSVLSSAFSSTSIGYHTQFEVNNHSSQHPELRHRHPEIGSHAAINVMCSPSTTRPAHDQTTQHLGIRHNVKPSVKHSVNNAGDTNPSDNEHEITSHMKLSGNKHVASDKQHLADTQHNVSDQCLNIAKVIANNHGFKEPPC